VFFVAQDASRHNAMQVLPPSLQEFIAADDLTMFGPASARSTQDPMTLQLPSGPLRLPHPAPSPPSSPVMSRRATAEVAAGMPLADILPLVHLTIRPASFPTVEGLYRHLDELDLTSEKRIRPTWDDYFSMFDSSR
jgi:hypothetical protein